MSVEVSADPGDIGAQAETATLIVDALLGTGLREPAREPLATAIRALNASDAAVLWGMKPVRLGLGTGAALFACFWLSSHQIRFWRSSKSSSGGCADRRAIPI